MRAVLAAALAVAGLLAPAARAGSQDFAPAAPGPAPAGGASVAAADAFLESGLPPRRAGAALDVSLTRWYGLPELETRAAVCAVGWRSLRVAAGLAQTGEPDVGWSAAGLACGVARPEGGAGLRAIGRRDRAAPAGATLAERAGVEVGWGAWLRAARGLDLWAAVPQSWTAGVAPPLERPLELGAALALDDLAVWLTRAAPVGDAADHAAGVALRSGPLLAWAFARDRPLRGGCGLAATTRGLRLAAVVESHPDLGETVRLSLGLAGGAR